MKSIQEVNMDLLHMLFEWKRKEGNMIRFSIEMVQNRWILSFFSIDFLEKDKHIFASFVGKTHDELKHWALDRLVEYKMSEKNLVI
ncbi:MAG TPA: hypothetical protein VJ824_01700 [Bacillota bacterium]|nr:hypothetical protein [Bacillota bacterium]